MWVIKRWLTSVVVLSLAIFMFACNSNDSEAPSAKVGASHYKRVVSLSPSVTEIIFAIGAGDKLAGVSDYCDYPEGALEKPKVGGYMSPNFEAIARLKPDLVLLVGVQNEGKNRLEKLGFKTETVSNASVDDVISTMLVIGELLDAKEKAELLAKSLKSRLEAIVEKTKGRKKPTLLFVVGRDYGANTIRNVFVAGKNSFFNDLIKIAGAVNAYEGSNIDYPKLSAEAIIRLRPDIIVEAPYGHVDDDPSGNAIKKDWDALALEGFKNYAKIHILRERFMVRPSPRMVELAETLAKIAHPDAGWE